LGKVLRSAYSDLFLANTKANALPLEKVKGIIATKTSKGDVVNDLMARTFLALAKVADFSEEDASEAEEQHLNGEVKKNGEDKSGIGLSRGPGFSSTLHYNIQIHLPTTTDISVYNSIFKSMKEHLL
jgi:hypothetical protein